MPSARRGLRLLLGLTGLSVDGGIASVNRCVMRVLDERLATEDVERIDCIVLHGEGDPETAPGARAMPAGGSQLRFVWQLWSTALRSRPDLIFFDHIGLARAMTLPLPGLRGRTYAVFVHGGELLAAGSGQRAAAVLGAERVLVNSDFTGDLVKRIYGETCPPVHVVKLCIDPARIGLWEADARPTPSAREPAVLIVGRMVAEEPGKGHDELLEAWPTVLEAVPEAKLWIAGSGDDADRLRLKATDLHLEGSVSFLGRIPDEELRDRYLRASLFAMPSRQEGFGIVYAEAMWHGLPCLGSRADAAQTIIDHGETGVLVPYGDVPAIAAAISDLLSDPKRARRMGEAAMRIADSRFGFARFREDLLAALPLPAAE